MALERMPEELVEASQAEKVGREFQAEEAACSEPLWRAGHGK